MKGTVLLIEDNDNVIKAAQEALNTEGYDVISAKSILDEKVLKAVGLQKIPVPPEPMQDDGWWNFEAEMRRHRIRPISSRTEGVLYLAPDKNASPVPGIICCLDDYLGPKEVMGSVLLETIDGLHRAGMLKGFDPDEQTVVISSQTQSSWHAAAKPSAQPDSAQIQTWVTTLVKKVAERQRAISAGDKSATAALRGGQQRQ